jgi:hypothetical protein
MKIYRGPQTGKRWKETAAKKPREYIKGWEPGQTISFNATIDGVQRFTEIGVQIEEADLLALFCAFLKNYRQKHPELLAELETSRTELRKLRSAIRQIYRLIAFKTPSEETLKEVRDIALKAREA